MAGVPFSDWNGQHQFVLGPVSFLISKEADKACQAADVLGYIGEHVSSGQTLRTARASYL